MHHRMSRVQFQYNLSDRLIRAICNTSLVPDEEDVEDLIDSGAEVNLLHGTLLPLHCACMVSDVDMVKLLLERGAEVNLIDGYSRAAIHYAAERDLDCLQTLLQNKALPSILDGNDCSALHWSAFKNNVDCVRVLLQYGVAVDGLDFNLNTPLGWSAPRGNFDTVSLLLDYNADPDIVNYNEETPLKRCYSMLASGLEVEGLLQCIELLNKATGYDYTHDSEVIERGPRTLSHQCRVAVRRAMPKGYLPQLVLELPLPVRIQNYVLLRS